MATKKSAPKKSVPKKAASKKIKTKKASPKKAVFPGDTDEDQTKGDCKCKQKRPNGSFFCFRLEQGRWVQASAVPFPTRELCEEANC
jgi:hypothetical protein